MGHESTRRVLIAGGGIAGLAVRRALHRRGIPSLTLERRETPEETGLAINLPGNAVRALADLGLLEGLRAVGSRVRRREYRTASDRLLFAVDEDTFWGYEYGPHCVRRADLLRLLDRGLPAEDVRRGVSVNAVRPSPGRHALELADGSTETGALLVGADGIHSMLRRCLFGDQAPGVALLATQSWRFMAPNPGLEAWTLWAGNGALFLLIPVDRGEAYGWVSAPDGFAPGAGPTALEAVFAPFPRLVRDTLAAALAQPASLHHSPLAEVRIPAWSRDSVILVGDAAHASASVWAQGAALALEDALVLADLTATRSDWGHLGAAFEALRRPRVDHVQAMTDRMSRSARMPPWARRVLLPIIGPRSYRATYLPLREPALTPAGGE
ncbi:MAG: FAD-dependent monooxygenase [Parafilimonas terrae]|nr:FAD-dependent monooxygenase [Parafilimonas terrae]